MANGIFRTVAVAALAAAGFVAVTGGASAQYVLGGFGVPRGFHGVYVPMPPMPVPYPGNSRLLPAEVLDDVRDQGFRPIGIAGRNAEVWLVDAVHPRGHRVRLVVDAFDGEILAAHASRTAPARVAARTFPDRMNPGALPSDKARPVAPKSGEKPANKAVAGALAGSPVPPKRPVTLPAPVPAPAATPPASSPTTPGSARRTSEWAPINSVPVAPLD